MRVYGRPDGEPWQDGQLWKNLDLARTFRRLVEAEREALESRAQRSPQPESAAQGVYAETVGAFEKSAATPAA